MDFRKGRHSVSILQVHLVFVVKYRRRILDERAIEWLAQHFERVCLGMDCQLIAANGEPDHMHCLIEYPPKMSVSALVNALKGSSSHKLRGARPDIAEKYWKSVLWTPAYFAGSTGGATLETVKKYVEQQSASSPS